MRHGRLTAQFRVRRASVKIEGAYKLPGTAQEVWDLFTDPARLAQLLPGCERLEPDGVDRYKVAVKFGLAAISGKFAGSVVLSEKKPPHSLRIEIENKGPAGFMKGNGQLELIEKGSETEVKYAGDAQVGGMIAAVGQRLMEAGAKKMIEECFQRAAGLLKK